MPIYIKIIMGMGNGLNLKVESVRERLIFSPTKNENEIALCLSHYINPRYSLSHAQIIFIYMNE